MSALQPRNQKQTKDISAPLVLLLTNTQENSFLLKINTFMCCVISTLGETISYPPLVLWKGLEDKKLLKFYLLILSSFAPHMESGLFLPCQDSAQPSFHAGQGNKLFFYFGTIISSLF